MSLKYRTKLSAEVEGNPYWACLYGYSDIEGYMDCNKCRKAHEGCDILEHELFMKNNDNYYRKLREQSMENRARYYRTEEGFWHDEEFNPDGWKKAPKNKYFSDIPAWKFCWEGASQHPNFWKCESCGVLSSCELGKFRIEKIARKKAEKKLKAEQNLKKIGNKFKNFFEKVADFFGGL